MCEQIDPHNLETSERHLHVRISLAFIMWFLLVVSLYFSLKNVDDEVQGLARKESVANFKKDQALQIWATNHGGVYVPITARAQPNSYFTHIPGLDLVTPTGVIRLTLISPVCYMLQQLLESQNGLYGVKGKGRITSRKPLDPDNTPDAWETAVLKAFEKDEKDVLEKTMIDGQPFLRLIRPVVTQEGCFKCHGHQRYEVGEVHGGADVSVTLMSYVPMAIERKNNLWVIMIVVLAVGMGVIWLVGRHSQQRIVYEKRIWKQANFDALTGLSNRNLCMDRLD